MAPESNNTSDLSDQQTEDVNTILFQCRPTVEDGGPTLKQYRVNVFCLQHCVNISCFLGAST